MASGKDRIPMSIFIADDDPDDRTMIREAIEVSGLDCIIREFVDGEALMQALQESQHSDSAAALPADLVMLDLRMPKKDGIAVLREIKYHPRLKVIPVIMFTGDISEAAISKAFDVGANAYIQKSEILGELVQFLRAVNIMWGRPFRRSSPEQPTLNIPDEFSPINILQVDDDPDSTSETSLILGHSQLVNKLLSVGDGEALWRYLEGEGPYADRIRHPLPDLVLMDLMLPGRDGIELIRSLKQDDRFRDLPIIALTGSLDPDLASRARAAGAEGVEEKPISRTVLVDIVSAIGGMYLSIVKRVPMLGSRKRRVI